MIALSSAWHTAVVNNVTSHSSVACKNMLLVYYGVEQLKRLVKQHFSWATLKGGPRQFQTELLGLLKCL